MRASPALDGRGLVSQRPTEAAPPTLSGCPVSQAKPPLALSAVRELGEPTPVYPLSPPKLAVGIPTPLPRARARFPTPNHGHSSTNPEYLPPTSPASSPELSPEHLPRAATSTSASPPSVWLPTCFHVSIPRDARPGGRRLFAWTIRAAYRPSASTTECPTSTPANRPIFSRSGGKPPDHQTSSPLARFARPDFPRSGVGAPFEHLDPRHGDRSPRRIYPNLTDPNTLCREPVSPLDRKNFEDRRSCGSGSLSDELTQRAETSPTSLLGPPREAPRERKPRSAASRVPSTPRSLRPRSNSGAPIP